MTLLLQECNPQTDFSPPPLKLQFVWSQRKLWCHIAQQTLTDHVSTQGFCWWTLCLILGLIPTPPPILLLLLFSPLCRSSFSEYFCVCWCLQPQLAELELKCLKPIPKLCFCFQPLLMQYSKETNGMSAISESTLEIATSSSLPPVKTNSICNQRQPYATHKHLKYGKWFPIVPCV